MLVLSRKIGERLLISEGVVLTVLSIRGKQVRLGLAAPQTVSILRDEVSTATRPSKKIHSRRGSAEPA